MRLRRTLISATLALGVLLASVSASAQESDADARARRHFESGTAYFEVGDYDNALRELQVAYDISHRPALLYNLYMTHERLGQFAEAAANLERYLAEAPDVENRSVLEERLARLRERAAVATVPTTAVPATTSVSEPVTLPVDPPTAPGPPILTISGFTLAGIGVVMIAVGGGLVLAEDAGLQECSPGCAPSRVATLDAATIVADVGLGATVLGAILGVIGLVVETGSPSRGGSAGVSLRGRSLLVAF